MSDKIVDLHERIQEKAEETEKRLDEILGLKLQDPEWHERVCEYGASYLEEYLLKVMDEQDLLVDMKIDKMRPRLRRVYEAVQIKPNSAFHVLFRMWTRVKGSMDDKEWLVNIAVKQLHEEKEDG